MADAEASRLQARKWAARSSRPPASAQSSARRRSGAAAFIIAEFLHITYLKVIVMAAIPALLYFLSIFLMIEADTRRAGARPVPIAHVAALAADEAPRLSLPRGRRHPAHADPRHVAVPRRVLLDADRGRAQLRRPRERALAAPPACARSTPARAACFRVASTTATAGIIVGDGDADRTRAEDRRPHRRSRRRASVPDGLLLRARDLDARPRRAGHRVVHHRGRHGGAGDDARSACPTSPRTCSSSTTRCCRR